jgi:hypothetical protein
MSFSTGGRPSSSKVGISVDGPQHQPDAPLLDEGVDAEAADAGGEMAKLHSLVASNSAACGRS